MSSRDETQLWEQQPGESSKAFAAFAHYRDQGPERTLRATSDALGHSVGGVVRDWSAQYGWRTRSAAFDAYLDRQKVQARVREVREMERRHAQAASVGLSALSLPAIALSRDRRVNGVSIPRLQELEEMPTDELLRLAARTGNALSRLVGVERLSRGEPTEIVAATHENAAPPPMADEERLALLFAAVEEVGLGRPQHQLGPAVIDADEAG